jgi:hypothetical protein
VLRQVLRLLRRHVDLHLQVLPLLEHHLLRLLFCIEDLVGLVEQLDAIDVRILEDILVRGPLANVEDREGFDRIGSSSTFWKRSTRCELSASITSILSVLSALRPDSPSSSWHVRRQSASSVLTKPQTSGVGSARLFFLELIERAQRAIQVL